MKNTLAFLLVLIAGVGIGLALSRWSSGPGLSAETESAVAQREILYWKAPMDRQVTHGNGPGAGVCRCRR